MNLHRGFRRVPDSPSSCSLASGDFARTRASPRGLKLSASWAWLALAFVLAFAAYSFYWGHAPFSNGDTFSYVEVAQDFLAHGHFSQPHIRTPGLPLFLLLVGTGRTYFHATLLLHIVSVGALALLLSRLRVRLQPIWIFVLVSLLPAFVQNTAYLATEGITAAFLALGLVAVSLYVLDRHWAYALFASFCFAWAGITRPTNLPAPFLLAAVLLALQGRRMIGAAALVLCVPTLLLGGYIAHSAHNPRDFEISSMIGYQLSNATVPLYEYIDNPIAREELLRARSEMDAEGLSANFGVWRAQPILEKRMGLSENELGEFLLRMNLGLILHHPEVYLEQIARGSNAYWFPYATQLITKRPFWKASWYGLQILVVVAFLFELTVLIGLFVGSRLLNRALDLGRERAMVYLLAITIIFETMIVSYAVIGSGSARYRSVTDLLLLFAVALITDWGQTTWRTNHRALDSQTPQFLQPF
jgi:hypothetical protein